MPLLYHDRKGVLRYLESISAILCTLKLGEARKRSSQVIATCGVVVPSGVKDIFFLILFINRDKPNIEQRNISRFCFLLGLPH